MAATEPRSTTELVSLLLELTRVVKARRYFEPGDARLTPLFEHARRAWTADLRRHGLLDLVIEGGRLEQAGQSLPIDARLEGALSEWNDRGLRRIQVEPGLDGDALAGLVEVLAMSDDALGAEGGFARALIQRVPFGIAIDVAGSTSTIVDDSVGTLEADAEQGIEAGLRADVDPDLESDLETDADLESDLEMDTNPDLESVLETDPEPLPKPESARATGSEARPSSLDDADPAELALRDTDSVGPEGAETDTATLVSDATAELEPETGDGSDEKAVLGTTPPDLRETQRDENPTKPLVAPAPAPHAAPRGTREQRSDATQPVALAAQPEKNARELPASSPTASQAEITEPDIIPPVAESAIEPGIESATEPGKEAGAESGIEPGKEAGAESGIEPGKEAGAESGIEPGKEAGAESGIEPGKEAGAESGIEPGKEAGAESGIEPGKEAGAESEIEPGKEAGAESGIEPGKEAGAESGIEPGKESRAESAIESGIEPGNEASTEPRKELATEPTADSAPDSPIGGSPGLSDETTEPDLGPGRPGTSFVEPEETEAAEPRIPLRPEPPTAVPRPPSRPANAEFYPSVDGPTEPLRETAPHHGADDAEARGLLRRENDSDTERLSDDSDFLRGGGDEETQPVGWSPSGAPSGGTDGARGNPSDIAAGLLREIEHAADETATPELVESLVTLVEAERETLGHGAILQILSTLAAAAEAKSEDEARKPTRAAIRRLAVGESLEALLAEAGSRGTGAERAARVLTQLGPEIAGPLAVRAIHEVDEGRAALLTERLLSLGPVAVRGPIIELMRTDDRGVLLRALAIAERVGGLETVGRISELLHSSDEFVREAAARSLAHQASAEGGEDPQALRSLARGLGSSDPHLAVLCAECLISTHSARAVEPLGASLRAAIEASDLDTARDRIRALGELGRAEAASELGELLLKKSLFGRRRLRELKLAATHALSRLPGDQPVGVLSQAARLRDPQLRAAAEIALERRSPGPRLD